MDLNEELRVTDAWSLKGELTLSCNCEVFCPCVLSLGQSAPTEGYCLTWACVRVDEGHFGETDLAGVKFGFMAEIPGKLGRGNWTVALFVDDKASAQASKALTWIMTGRAGGSTGLLKILAGSFLGINGAGRTAIVRTRGNRHGHIVLRGGGGRPNYDTVSVRLAARA